MEIKSPRLCRFEPERAAGTHTLRRRPLLSAGDAATAIWVTRRFIFLQLSVHDLVARLRGARESHLKVCAVHGNEFLARRSTQDSSRWLPIIVVSQRKMLIAGKSLGCQLLFIGGLLSGARLAPLFSLACKSPARRQTSFLHFIMYTLEHRSNLGRTDAAGSGADFDFYFHCLRPTSSFPTQGCFTRWTSRI